MPRQWGRAPIGERICEAAPQGRWQVLDNLSARKVAGIRERIEAAARNCPICRLTRRT
jgi:hypothetical protein